MTKLSGKTVETAERRLACENSRFTVYMDHPHTALNYEVKDYLVVVPKIISESLTSGVAVLPFRDKKLVWFVSTGIQSKKKCGYCRSDS